MTGYAELEEQKELLDLKTALGMLSDAVQPSNTGTLVRVVRDRLEKLESLGFITIRNRFGVKYMEITEAGRVVLA